MNVEDTIKHTRNILSLLSDDEIISLRHYLLDSYARFGKFDIACTVGMEAEAGNELALKAMTVRKKILEEGR